MTRVIEHKGFDYDVKRIYVATPIDTLTRAMRKRTVERVRMVLDRDWKAVERYFPLAEQIDDKGEISLRTHDGRWTHDLNRSELERCDMIVAFNPGLSVGVNYEIGFMDALGKPVKVYELRELPMSRKPFMLMHHEVQLEY